jgi:hypothetical protein
MDLPNDFLAAYDRDSVILRLPRSTIRRVDTAGGVVRRDVAHEVRQGVGCRRSIAQATCSLGNIQEVLFEATKPNVRPPAKRGVAVGLAACYLISSTFSPARRFR